MINCIVQTSEWLSLDLFVFILKYIFLRLTTENSNNWYCTVSYKKKLYLRFFSFSLRIYISLSLPGNYIRVIRLAIQRQEKMVTPAERILTFHRQHAQYSFAHRFLDAFHQKMYGRLPYPVTKKSSENQKFIAHINLIRQKKNLFALITKFVQNSFSSLRD